MHRWLRWTFIVVQEENGVPKGIRTPVTAVKGRCPRPLDDGDAGARSALGLAGGAVEINHCLCDARRLLRPAGALMPQWPGKAQFVAVRIG